jgi:hypothetical protein
MTFFAITGGVLLLGLFGVAFLRGAYQSWRHGGIITPVAAISLSAMMFVPAIYLLITYPLAILGLLLVGALFVYLLVNDGI